jgi:phage gp37-like protein
MEYWKVNVHHGETGEHYGADYVDVLNAVYVNFGGSAQQSDAGYVTERNELG